ncbi:MAG: cephalosporin hydroxylase [Alphaproteobacteria bacterium]|jgi:cephalosporin hydroxylase|nr:cephalosporin hydroxylase [Alphaproteobacteria bacterium]
MQDHNTFLCQRNTNIQKIKHIDSFLARKLDSSLFQHQYAYNFDWLGLPIIQYPQDIVALQEIIWATKPDVIIEMGVARGGSVIFHASMLHLLNSDGKVIGVDIDIRDHNREAVENHPLSFRVKLIQGSSVESATVEQVKSLLKPTDRVMLVLDSNHTHDHVLQELELYSSLVTKGCYLVVLDTCIEDLPDELFHDRPWGKGNNPKTAVHQFMKTTDRFEIDEIIPNKLVLTVAPDGYLKCIR